MVNVHEDDLDGILGQLVSAPELTKQWSPDDTSTVVRPVTLRHNSLKASCCFLDS